MIDRVAPGGDPIEAADLGLSLQAAGLAAIAPGAPPAPPPDRPPAARLAERRR
ncbi:hypothetical protein, partial [Actinotalea caeni]